MAALPEPETISVLIGSLPLAFQEEWVSRAGDVKEAVFPVLLFWELLETGDRIKEPQL
jgi:hypothetical protein